jgi:hypothetical protein
MEKRGIQSIVSAEREVGDDHSVEVIIPRGFSVKINALEPSETEPVDVDRRFMILTHTHLSQVHVLMITSAIPAAPEIEPEKMMDLLEAAWAVIANSGVFNNPEEPSPGCREAAERWRDQYHRTLTAWCKRHTAEGPGSSD